MYARETLAGFPLHVKSPARRRPLLRSKSAAPKRKTPVGVSFFLEVTPGFEPGNEGFADPCLTTWLCHRMTERTEVLSVFGAGDEARTRYLDLGKVALYQMSYARKWCLRSELNQRHADFQSAALPTELQRHMATKMGLEPTTSSVTGWRSNQLNYLAIFLVGTTGLEPVTPCL